MRTPSATELLCAWERALSRPAALRGIAVLESCCPGTDGEELARLPIGQRDARLLELRSITFGPSVPCIAKCGFCGESLDVEFGLEEIRQRAPALEAGGVGALRVEAEGWEVRARLPNSLDLEAAAGARDAEEAKGILLSRCVESVAAPDGQTSPLEALPAQIIAAISDRMSEADPQGDVRLELNCPECGGEGVFVFDIGTYLWEELQAFAKSLMGEVHELAHAYSWSESDILNMSAQRRSYYLEMIGA
ncbi:MAG TPA: phage baseplate protein [Phycisphaerae bacterium]|nr:phage baseplate protein [Phycisphaerae bacterium]